MKITVQNMVCRHCVEALGRILRELEIPCSEVGLGYADVPDGVLTPELEERLDRRLAEQGFARVSDADDRLVQAVKAAVIDHVRNEAECRLKLSACIEEHLGVPYATLSRVFSARQGRTIEKYAIAMRIEWVKELLSYGTLSIAEIAFRTGFSSAAHLSRRFKDVTGLTPTQFVEAGAPRRSLAEV